jgi:CDP-glucose 4,6-dehydratase
MQAATPLEIRSPDSIRPWQHVLEALGGYIHLTKCLIEGDAAKAGAWNFGPAPEDARPVRAIVDQLARLWGGDGDWRPPPGSQPAEAATLTLDCTKAQTELGWRPIMNLDQALNLVVEWHRAHDQGFDAREITLGQIRSYRRAATEARQSMKVVLNA